MSQQAKTYAETKKAAPFDWNAFLQAPSHTREEWVSARRLSSSWVTCACGRQCAALARDFGGQPEDGPLRRLGMQFMHALNDNDSGQALSILAQIEARSAALLAGATMTL